MLRTAKRFSMPPPVLIMISGSTVISCPCPFTTPKLIHCSFRQLLRYLLSSMQGYAWTCMCLPSLCQTQTQINQADHGRASLYLCICPTTRLASLFVDLLVLSLRQYSHALYPSTTDILSLRISYNQVRSIEWNALQRPCEDVQSMSVIHDRPSSAVIYPSFFASERQNTSKSTVIPGTDLSHL